MAEVAMALKRTEAEVVGHDASLKGAIDELTDGRPGGDPLYPESGKGSNERDGNKENFDPRRFQTETVPPALAKAMAAVDLRKIDGTFEDDAITPDMTAEAPPKEETPRSRADTEAAPRGRLMLAGLVGAFVLVVVAAIVAWVAGRGPAPEISPPEVAPGETTAVPNVASPRVASPSPSSPVSSEPATTKEAPSAAPPSQPKPSAKPGAKPTAKPTASPSRPAASPDYDPQRPVF
jgi:hypothetical protein